MENEIVQSSVGLGKRQQSPKEFFPVLKIDKISDDVHIENTMPFLRLVNCFNIAEHTKYEVIDVLESGPIFRKFYDFVVHNIIRRKIIVQKELAHVFMAKIDDLRLRYQQDDMEKRWDKIFEEVFRKEGLNRKDEYVIWAHKKFKRAWIDMDDVFNDDMRRTCDEHGKFQETFTHLTGTMKILFEDLLPSLHRIPRAQWLYLIIIALLHDVIEKPGSHVTKKTLKRDFGVYIAKGVACLSKKSVEKFITDSQEQQLMKTGTKEQKEDIILAAKERRNHSYFDSLATLDIGYLAVKIADRIHNLLTLKCDSVADIERKLAETRKYFLIPEIRKRIPIGYDLIEKEVEKLDKWLKGKSVKS